MPAYKDETRNNWYCAFYFEDWNGERKKKMANTAAVAWVAAARRTSPPILSCRR